MGWTSYHAEHYKNGKVNRKAECDAYFLEGLNSGYFDVLKSAMVGNVYYAAVCAIAKKDNETGELVSIPKEERTVFAVVFLTSVDSKDYFNFAYKDIDETMGPCESKCPKSILNLLSPTDSEWAMAWRKRCLENAEKSPAKTLDKLPIGTVITFLRNTPEGEQEIKLVKSSPAYGKKYPFWMYVDRYMYMPKSRIPLDYKIVRLESTGDGEREELICFCSEINTMSGYQLHYEGEARK